jgi:hypothetical protein
LKSGAPQKCQGCRIFCAGNMQAHNSVSPRFARNASEESRTRRITYRI